MIKRFLNTKYVLTTKVPVFAESSEYTEGYKKNYVHLLASLINIHSDLQCLIPEGIHLG
jgi:hypothetical protein